MVTSKGCKCLECKIQGNKPLERYDLECFTLQLLEKWDLITTWTIPSKLCNIHGTSDQLYWFKSSVLRSAITCIFFDMSTQNKQSINEFLIGSPTCNFTNNLQTRFTIMHTCSVVDPLSMFHDSYLFDKMSQSNHPYSQHHQSNHLIEYHTPHYHLHSDMSWCTHQNSLHLQLNWMRTWHQSFGMFISLNTQ